jgi:hypothetical protein
MEGTRGTPSCAPGFCWATPDSAETEPALSEGRIMPDTQFIDKVRRLKVHERAVREPAQVRSELTRVFPSLERLLAALEEIADDAKLEVTRQKGKYILRIRR